MAKSLTELGAEHKQLLDQANGIDAKAKAENRQLSTEEATQIDALIVAMDANEAEQEAAKKSMKDDEERRAKLSKKAADSKKGQGRQSSHAIITEQRDNVLDDPKKGFKSPRDFTMAVIDAGRGREIDPRLAPLAAAGSDEARGNSDPAGGFLVPEGFSPNLLQINPEDDPVGALTTKVPMTNPLVRMPARVDTTHTTSVTGGLTVTRRPETVAGTSSQMTLSRVQLEAHTLFGLSYATEEILTDSPISFAAILSAGFSEQMASHILKERLHGTGIGEFLGVVNADCTVSAAKETGQAAATIVKENIDAMRSRCYGYSKAVWLYNHDCLPQLKSLVQAVGTGGAPVSYFTVDANGNSMLDGRPAYPTEYCKALGTTGDILLGNWSEYLEGLYQPLESAESIHVRFVNHERAFKFWLRNAGTPWWKAALTPVYSSATLSPFVKLDTRS